MWVKGLPGRGNSVKASGNGKEYLNRSEGACWNGGELPLDSGRLDSVCSPEQLGLHL